MVIPVYCFKQFNIYEDAHFWTSREILDIFLSIFNVERRATFFHWYIVSVTTYLISNFHNEFHQYSALFYFDLYSKKQTSNDPYNCILQIKNVLLMLIHKIDKFNTRSIFKSLRAKLKFPVNTNAYERHFQGFYLPDENWNCCHFQEDFRDKWRLESSLKDWSINWNWAFCSV